MPPEDEIHQLRADVAGQSARIIALVEQGNRFDKWLQNISDEIRKKPEKNSTPIYVGLVMMVSVLITLGTFALAPVTSNLDRIDKEVHALRAHDDGHPEAVLRHIKQVDLAHTKERDRMLAVMDRTISAVNAIVTRQAELSVIVNERKESVDQALAYRDRIYSMQSQDRITKSEHELHSASMESRLKRLEMEVDNGVINDN